jgi:putative peptidoglycan lipid II flippase
MGSRLLGLARDAVFAFFFGATHEADAFNVAFRIPNLLRDLFAEGAMSAAFVPTFTRYLTTRPREDAWRLGNVVFNALLVATLALAAAGAVFAEPLVGLLAGAYRAVPGKFELTVSLARMMLPFLTLVALAAVCMGMLNALRRFFVPALSPAMFNVGTIVTMLVLVPVFAAAGVRPIVAVAVGTLVGGFGQIAIQWPGLTREGYRYRLVFDWRHEGLHEVGRLMLPAIVGLAAVQVNLFVNTILAASEGQGAVSWLQYAFRLMYLPIGLFGVSVATAVLPTFASHAAAGDRVSMRRSVSDGLRMMLMLNVPATAGLVALASPIVALLYERGLFGPSDTAATASAVIAYAPGLVGYSTVKIAAPCFYALGESRVPVTVSVTTMVINVALNVILVKVMGFPGLALGTAAASLANATVLLVMLRRRLGGIDGTRLAPAVTKVSVASVVMAVFAVWFQAWAGGLVAGDSSLPRLLRLTTTIGFSLVVLAAAAKALRLNEFNEAARLIGSRLARLGGRNS